jgi:protein SCO1/2
MTPNPFTLAAQNLVLRIPLSPVSVAASDTPLGPIGIAVNSVVLFNQYAAGRQPLGPEIHALRSVAQYSADAFDGVYQTWYESGGRYELRTFANGREAGRQQAWTADGSLYLNYDARDGRRYGLVNARPSLTTTASGSDLPYYASADFTPAWAPSPPRVLQIELTSQRGRRVTGADLEGRPYVASFLFTRCTTVCPALVRQLARVQDATTIQLVSYSVTPAADTPAVLEAFGRTHGVDPDRWLLLTGEARRIYAAARLFYFAGDDRAGGEDTFLHTEKVLLVDGRGRLRGVYDGTLAHDVDRRIADAAALEAAHSSS